MSDRTNFTDQRFGWLTAIRFVQCTVDNRTIWQFRCDCGQLISRRIDGVRKSARNGSVPSCGCYRAERRPSTPEAIAEREQRREARAALAEESNRRHGLLAGIQRNRQSVPPSMHTLPARIISERHTRGHSFTRAHMPGGHSSAFATMEAAP